MAFATVITTPALSHVNNCTSLGTSYFVSGLLSAWIRMWLQHDNLTRGIRRPSFASQSCLFRYSSLCTLISPLQRLRKTIPSHMWIRYSFSARYAFCRTISVGILWNSRIKLRSLWHLWTVICITNVWPYSHKSYAIYKCTSTRRPNLSVCVCIHSKAWALLGAMSPNDDPAGIVSLFYRSEKCMFLFHATIYVSACVDEYEQNTN